MNEPLEDYIRRHDGVIFAESHIHPDNPVVYRAVFAAAHAAGVTQSVIELPPHAKPTLVKQFSQVAEFVELGLPPDGIVATMLPRVHSSHAHVLYAFSHGMEVKCVDLGKRHPDDAIYVVTSMIARESEADTDDKLMEAIRANQHRYGNELGVTPSMGCIVEILKRYQANPNIHNEIEQRRLMSDPLIAAEIVRQTEGQRFVGVFGANHAAGVKHPGHVNVTESLRRRGLNIGLVAVSEDLHRGCMSPDFVLKVG